MITRYLYPQIKKADLVPIAKCAIVGALVAGVYGIVHDQITFTISPEYFTNLKFKQFRYADFGLGNRIFVATIGFLATWWVGLFIGYFFGRRFIPDQSRDTSVKNIRNGFLIVIACAAVFALGSCVYGYAVEPAMTLSNWSFTLKYYGVFDGLAFVRVAYIHNASYAGGLFGLVVTFIFVRPKSMRQRPRAL